ncbi:MAG: 16S rRNA (cytidine(1402)-2'-O)-methyltransferase [Bacteroidales bacterium]|nr:16S rRNA (cytidine(1402)-2'-O)-methyltransferase [Bacteroidales bacterium]MDD7609139.1 16S rRNA (cytidine(1402)-2'-O)-methyltransferase [Bacteroidales bacterium]MDY5459205.1 16S rRNA (cytidine(1402)-2'-O)-methyltransferase [Candidatus Cryptobacteroides sp.]MEE0340796.1 16S rRNA (cytidine(1402)-2'-O)-methyltransferase [Bacteroidales bacterium]
MKAGILYIVPTPVGNLADMTYRAVEVLRSVDLILAEDTRTSSILLQHYGIEGRVLSHHKFNEHQTSAQIKKQILEDGLSVALISDAGTPGISDPGFLLVRECAAEGIEVQTLPGATACIPAIVSSGLPCDRFCFEGFLPQKKGRSTRLEALKEETRTMIFYESPYRLVKTLEQFAEAFGPDRACCVSREISKLHETHHRGTITELLNYFYENEPKGEIVITLAGAPVPKRGEHTNKYKLGDL